MFLGLDLGTSGVKALLIDDAQSPIAEGHAPLTVERPHSNWSEQDPNSWITACKAAIAAVRAEAPQAFAALKGIAVSGQMHGATLLDEADNPLRPAILWNDGRSAAQCEALEARADFRGIGGNIVMAGFTAPKLEWVRQNEPEVFAKTRKVLLPKDYVGLWLTGRHMSEMSDAAGTLWLDVGKRDWSDALLAATGLDRSHMPQLIQSAVHSFCHALPDTWHQMGVILSATDSLNWLADLAGRSAKDLTTAIDDLPSAASPVTFLPYLSGERTPHNAPDASASFLGLKRQHGLTEMTQAVMEGVAFALNDCRRAIDQSGAPLTSAWVAGGGSQSKAWLNMIAAATGLTLKVPASGSQGAALGAARLAMAASGMTDVFGTPDLQESIAPDPALAAFYAERQKLFRNVYPALP